jgi:hypothetical protein
VAELCRFNCKPTPKRVTTQLLKVLGFLTHAAVSIGLDRQTTRVAAQLKTTGRQGAPRSIEGRMSWPSGIVPVEIAVCVPKPLIGTVGMPRNYLGRAHLRIARPTDRLDEVVTFYLKGLGFDELASFKDHDGFDGVILGHAGAGYHLEFTHTRGHSVGSSPSQDHLLVFYLPDTEEWHAAIRQMESLRILSVPAFNPYWDKQGKSYEDPDGYRVVFQNSAWNHGTA